MTDKFHRDKSKTANNISTGKSNKDISVCFVLNHPNNNMGGSELQSRIIAEELEKKGWDSHFLSPTRGRTKIKKMSINGVDVHQVSSSLKPQEIRITIGQIRAVLQNIDPNIVYIRSTPIHGFFATVLAKWQGRHIVWHCPSDTECSYIGHTRRICRNINKIQSKFKELLRAMIKDFGLWLTKKCASKIILQSKEQKEMLKRNTGYNGSVVNKCHYDYYNEGNDKKSNDVIWISNIDPNKRVEKFIDLAKEDQSSSRQYIIVGDYKDKRYFDTIKHKIDEVKGLKYMGKVSFEKTNKMLSDASFFVNTSKEEGFPNTIIQAWLCKAITLTLEIDPDGLLADKKLGVKCSDIDEMHREIKKIHKNSEIKSRITSRARRFALRKYRAGRNSQKLKKMMEDLILNHKFAADSLT